MCAGRTGNEETITLGQALLGLDHARNLPAVGHPTALPLHRSGRPRGSRAVHRANRFRLVDRLADRRQQACPIHPQAALRLRLMGGHRYAGIRRVEEYLYETTQIDPRESYSYRAPLFWDGDRGVFTTQRTFHSVGWVVDPKDESNCIRFIAIAHFVPTGIPNLSPPR